ncbi:hypothetical protein MNBD_ALPHA02-160 [hydrothermal vent metagenome]|uniref:Activator of Hsp90 ATPase homologue 1/2-like C-terminal domain-containing protein n=1 Tax=hydrothermal vent metagenome TaxID=652676 RepID=A0A3B0RU16_9ZZZZ
MGNMNNYIAVIYTNVSPKDAFFVVAQEIGSWWSEFEGNLDKLGDEAAFSFKPNPTTWTFRVTGYEEGRYFELECIKANHIHEGLPETIHEEWLNTKLIFEIEPDGGGSKITLTHNGLVPTLDCYEICVSGWDHFFKDSLKNYLDFNSA